MCTYSYTRGDDWRDPPPAAAFGLLAPAVDGSSSGAALGRGSRGPVRVSRRRMLMAETPWRSMCSSAMGMESPSTLSICVLESVLCQEMA